MTSYNLNVTWNENAIRTCVIHIKCFNNVYFKSSFSLFYRYELNMLFHRTTFKDIKNDRYLKISQNYPFVLYFSFVSIAFLFPPPLLTGNSSQKISLKRIVVKVNSAVIFQNNHSTDKLLFLLTYNAHLNFQ